MLSTSSSIRIFQLFAFASFLSVAFSASLLRAQGAVGAATTERVTVTGQEIPLEDNILPNQRPLDSVFGIDMNVQDTPRAVTIVSGREIEEEHIRQFDDLVRAASNVFTAAQFGVPGLPQIRGQDGEVFENGLRRIGGNQQSYFNALHGEACFNLYEDGV